MKISWEIDVIFFDEYKAGYGNNIVFPAKCWVSEMI